MARHRRLSDEPPESDTAVHNADLRVHHIALGGRPTNFVAQSQLNPTDRRDRQRRRIALRTPICRHIFALSMIHRFPTPAPDR